MIVKRIHRKGKTDAPCKVCGTARWLTMNPFGDCEGCNLWALFLEITAADAALERLRGYHRLLGI